MTQCLNAKKFHSLHHQTTPLILYNVWDAATAKAAQNAGAKAIATGSWSIAAAQGYPDGEAIPFSFALQIIRNIIRVTDVPLSIDFEAGYAADISTLKENFAQLIDIGIAGINFEDQIIGSEKLYEIEAQSERIAALRDIADSLNTSIFINARTDLFLKEPDERLHAALLDPAIERGLAYLEQGADGIFIPGLSDPFLINDYCRAVQAPINIMVNSETAQTFQSTSMKVSRISYGPHPFFETLYGFEAKAKNAFHAR